MPHDLIALLACVPPALYAMFEVDAKSVLEVDHMRLGRSETHPGVADPIQLRTFLADGLTLQTLASDDNDDMMSVAVDGTEAPSFDESSQESGSQQSGSSASLVQGEDDLERS